MKSTLPFLKYFQILLSHFYPHNILLKWTKVLLVILILHLWTWQFQLIRPTNSQLVTDIIKTYNQVSWLFPWFQVAHKLIILLSTASVIMILLDIRPISFLIHNNFVGNNSLKLQFWIELSKWMFYILLRIKFFYSPNKTEQDKTKILQKYIMGTFNSHNCFTPQSCAPEIRQQWFQNMTA